MAALLCHPQAPSEAVQGITASASRAGVELVRITYRIRGDIGRLLIPPRRAPAPAERLWQHTCCEIFVASVPGGPYREFNFSPSGEWAAYAFARYRDGSALRVPDPGIEVRASPHELELQATIGVAPGRHCAALCAVMEERDGRLSYWSLEHAPGRPDFHHPRGFALELE